MNTRLFFVLILSFFSCHLQAQNPINFDSLLPADTTVRIGKLANGLTYYIRHNEEPKDQARLHLALQSGSLHEADDQQGVAHFVEHMAFNGTKHFEKNELIHFFERTGKSFGADLNAHTSFAETVYKLELNTDSIGLLDTALLILEDWASGLTFDTEEIEKERGVVISEWRARLNSSQRIFEQTSPVIYQNSRYLERFPIGDPTLLDTVHRQRLVDYYEEWYRPELMAIIAVGDFDVDWMEAEITRRFSRLPTSPSPKERQRYGLDETPRRSFLVATDPEAPFTKFRITYQLAPIPPTKTYNDLRTSLLYRLHNSMLNLRLSNMKEKEVQPFTFAYSGYSSLRNYQTYSISGMAEMTDLEAALAVVVKEGNRVIQHGFTEEELTYQKNKLLRSIEQAIKELDKIRSSSWVSIYQNAFLEELPLIMDRSKMTEIYKTVLEHITLEDLVSISQSWEKSTIQTSILTTTEDQAALLPDSSRWQFLIDSLKNVPTTPFETEAKPDVLFSQELPLTKSTFIGLDTTLNLHHYELENGVHVYLKPTDFDNDRILFKAFSDGGLSLVTDDEFYSGRHSLGIFRASGFGGMPMSTITSLMQNKQASCMPSISNYSEQLVGGSSFEDLETMFQLLYLQVTAPRFDSTVFQYYQQNQQNIYKRVDTDPRSAFGRMMIDLKFDYHLRRANYYAEEFKQIDMTVAERIYKERFGNAADFQFVFVGNFEVNSLLTLASKYIGNLPASSQRENWQNDHLQRVAINIDTTVIAGLTPKAEVNLSWHTDFPYSNRVERQQFTVLRRLLQKRFREHLREDLAGVYGVSVRGYTTPIPDSSAVFTVKFNCDIPLLDTLLAAIYQEIDAVAAGDIDPQDLENIVLYQKNSLKESREQNNFWLSNISWRIQQNLPLEELYTPSVLHVIDATSLEGVAAAAQKYIQQAYHHKFVLLPEGDE